MQDLEEKALEKINCEIPFYYRYVDDIVLAAPSDHVTKIVETFNGFHNKLQFTVEREKDKSVSFFGSTDTGDRWQNSSRLVS